MAANYSEENPKGTFNYIRSRALNGSNSFGVYANSPWSLGTTNRSTHGRDTANFHAKKKRGDLLPFTFFDQHEYESDIGYFTLDYQTHSYTATSGSRYSFENIPAGNVTSMGEKYLHDLVSYEGPLQSLAGQASGWDALTFAAEAHQLRSMLVGLVTKVATLLRSRPAKFTANQWLELRYGWRVLYYDMLSISEAYQALKTKRRFSKYTSGDSFSTSSTNFAVGGDSKCSYKWTNVTQNTFNIRARLVMKGEVNPIRINALATSWELIRLSFVVDWVLSVGKAIDALSLALSGAHYVVGAGYKVDMTSDATISEVTLSPSYKFTRQGTSSSHARGFAVSRMPASIPLRPLWNPRLTPGRTIDLVALILQRALR